MSGEVKMKSEFHLGDHEERQKQIEPSAIGETSNPLPEDAAIEEEHTSSIHTGMKSYKKFEFHPVVLEALGRSPTELEARQLFVKLNPFTNKTEVKGPYACLVCAKSDRAPFHVKTHIRVHTGERPYPCSICNQRFVKKSTLTRHLKTHTGEKSHQCQYCNKRFRTKPNLDRHVITHTGAKPFECQFCYVRFGLKQNLDKHVRTHTVEVTKQKPSQNVAHKFHEPTLQALGRPVTEKESLKLYVEHAPGLNNGGKCTCLICGKSSTPNNIERHLRTHTGDKPFKCNHCSKRFIQKTHLAHHIQTHKQSLDPHPTINTSVANLYKNEFQELRTKHVPCNQTAEIDALHFCPKCNKGFIKDFELQIHLQCCPAIVSGMSQQETKPEDDLYECQICFETFQELEQLKIHDQEHSSTAKDYFADDEEDQKLTESKPSETSETSFEEVAIEESSLKVEDEVKSDPDPVSTILQEFMTC